MYRCRIKLIGSTVGNAETQRPQIKRCRLLCRRGCALDRIFAFAQGNHAVIDLPDAPARISPQARRD
jgi:hypothetical protein